MLGATFFSALVHVVAESAPYLLFGFAAAGLLRALIPERLVYRLLGEESLRSVFLASLVGVPLPLCSCSVIPVAAGLHEQGAGKGATTSFLISTPETGVDSISITYALMDPIMTIARPLAAFATALFTGAAVGLLPESAGAPPADGAVAPSSCCDDDACGAPAAPPRRSWTEASVDGLRYAFGPLLDDLALWLIAGFILAAAVAAAVPDGTLAAIPAGWVSSLLMVLIGTPVYICASAATPIAAALVLKGLDPGAALVLLLVGPATNMTTILVVLRLLGRRVLAVYLVGVTACALAFGAAVNAVYAGWNIDPVVGVAAPEAVGISAVQAVSAIVLTVLLLYRVFRRLSPPPVTERESGTSTVLR